MADSSVNNCLAILYGHNALLLRPKCLELAMAHDLLHPRLSKRSIGSVPARRHNKAQQPLFESKKAMKKFLTALTVAAAFAMPSAASAQIDPIVSVAILDKPFQTVGTGYPEAIFGQGGGFLASFSIDNFPPSGNTENFNNFLIWCIDPDRFVSIPPSSYQAWTAADFAASGLGSAGGHDVTLGEMFTLAGLVGELSGNWDSLDATQRADYQGSIWNTFRGDAVLGGVTFTAPANLDDWYVLYSNENKQTFMFQVSAPADNVLLVFALSSFGAVMLYRRRRA